MKNNLFHMLVQSGRSMSPLINGGYRHSPPMLIKSGKRQTTIYRFLY